ncbi:lipopolysaccharide transport periplasmic protein LptA [Pseudoduganella sp. GCM10020061]|uniref:lipopolysaccharide transport periplasmic protein LptA n=1 Tax=Pseudoduganella sp. GCM10020061 TaxID=3317345 RepID=UPI00362BAE41
MKRHLIIASLCLFATAAWAEKADSNKPTTITAETADFDDVTQSHVLTGSVELQRGTLVMRSERATVRETPDGWQIATLVGGNGKLATFRQKRDGGADLWVEGRAERIEYDQRTEVAKLFSKANITQLDGKRVTDEVNGEYISYDSRKEVFAVRNDASGENKPGKGRVTLILAPRKTQAAQPAQPAPAAQPAQPAAQDKK